MPTTRYLPIYDVLSMAYEVASTVLPAAGAAPKYKFFMQAERDGAKKI